MSGKSNRGIREGTGKPTCSQPSRARSAVFKGGESDGTDPKPGDLHEGRVKRGESHVEAR